MELEKVRSYARLLAGMGVATQKGDEVWVYGQAENHEFIRLVVEECYKLGAKKVRTLFYDDAVERLDYQYMTVRELSKVPSYRMAELKYRVKNLPSMLYIDSEDPDSLKGINVNKITKSSMAAGKKTKPLRDMMECKYKWCIGAIPSKAWAKKVFPDLPVEEAIEKLWDAILMTSRAKEGDPLENWRNHNANLLEHRHKLESLDLQYLEYKASNGTNFKVELIKGINWGAGLELTDKGAAFNPNIPSEEVFTSPKAGSCDGILYASKPLSYQGQLIEDFWVKFENGKVCAVGARKNQKLLEDMVHMDEGASMLGEVALVPFESPINESGILFYNTLFDENAVCHVALGMGFKECLPGGQNMDNEKAHELGINDSMIHVDFMIGTRDLEIVGTSFSGKKTVIFKNGTWAI